MHSRNSLSLALLIVGSAAITSACSSHQPQAQQADVVTQQQPAKSPQEIQPMLATETQRPKLNDQDQEQVFVGNEPKATELDENLAMIIEPTEEELTPASTQAEPDPTEASEPLEQLEQPTQMSLSFGFNQTQLDSEDLAILQQHGEFLAQHPTIKVTINGHADAQGDATYNDHLALKRASYAASILQQQGVKSEQIEIQSWGSTIPVSVTAQHPENRRIELQYGAEFWVNNDN